MDGKLVPPGGDTDADIIVIGEAPGAEEVNKGRPFVGQSGVLLKSMIEQIAEEEDLPEPKIWYTNVVMCRDKENQPPTDESIEACNHRLEIELRGLPNAYLVPTGAVPTRTLGLGDKISKARGGWTKVGDRWSLPTWHPAYILRRPMDGIEFIDDLRKVVVGHDRARFDLNTPPEVHILDTPDMVIGALEGVKGLDVAFDFDPLDRFPCKCTSYKRTRQYRVQNFLVPS